MVATLKEAFGDLYKDTNLSVPCGWLGEGYQGDYYFDKSKKKCVQSVKTWLCPSGTKLNILQNHNIITCETGHTEDPCLKQDYTYDSTDNICKKK